MCVCVCVCVCVRAYVYVCFILTHPQVDCRVFVGGKQGVINPMVFNMAPGYDASKYDVIWVSTSRIMGGQGLVFFNFVEVAGIRLAA